MNDSGGHCDHKLECFSISINEIKTFYAYCQNLVERVVEAVCRLVSMSDKMSVFTVDLVPHGHPRHAPIDTIDQVHHLCLERSLLDVSKEQIFIQELLEFIRLQNLFVLVVAIITCVTVLFELRRSLDDYSPAKEAPLSARTAAFELDLVFGNLKF